MPKISSGSNQEHNFVKIRVVLEKVVDASRFRYQLDSEGTKERASENAIEVLEVLKYGDDSGCEPWAYTWEFDLWDDPENLTWELEVTDVES